MQDSCFVFFPNLNMELNPNKTNGIQKKKKKETLPFPELEKIQ